MKQTNQDTKKLKFTAFDAIILVVVIAMLAYVGYTVSSKAAAKKGVSADITFTAEVAIIDDDTATLIREGDVVTLSGRDTATIKKVEIKPARKMVFDSLSGTYGFESYPNKVDVTLVLTAPGLETDKDVKVGNTALRTGSNLNLKGKGYVANSLVLDVATTQKEVR